MNNSHGTRLYWLQWLLAAVFALPSLGWAHGAVDTPISRAPYCYTLPDFWNTPSDPGCRALDAVNGTYPGKQWNEVAKLIKRSDGYDYNDQATVERLIPDNQLCSAADPLKDGLNQVAVPWYTTTVIPTNGSIEVRLIATAPHVPSFVKIYLSKPGYNPATTKLKWSDLQQVHEERMDEARTDWGNQPPKVAGVSGYFTFNVPIPSGRAGKALLYTRWQRIDEEGEGFYSCSDINIAEGTDPEELHELGELIAADIVEQLKPGDSVHFRILDNSPAADEIVDITHQITQDNLDPNLWGKQIAQRVDAAVARIGERKGNEIVFNATHADANAIFASKAGYSKAMSIVPGGGDDDLAYREGKAYKAGDIVSNNGGRHYRCKPAPYTAWCAGVAWAYAPGTGENWAQAWDEIPQGN